jgi:hypothetical protein
LQRFAIESEIDERGQRGLIAIRDYPEDRNRLTPSARTIRRLSDPRDGHVQQHEC